MVKNNKQILSFFIIFTLCILMLISNFSTLRQVNAESETWVINSDANVVSFSGKSSAINFTSNGVEYKEIYAYGNLDGFFFLCYNSTDSLGFGGEGVWAGKVSWGSWTNDAYRTIIFSSTPTGDLATWLQANAVKQSTNTPTGDASTGVELNIAICIITFIALTGINIVFLKNKKKQ